jgi:hypothetical protein
VELIEVAGGISWDVLRIAAVVLILAPAYLIARTLLPAKAADSSERALATIVITFGSLIGLGFLLNAVGAGLTARSWLIAYGVLAGAVVLMFAVVWHARRRTATIDGTSTDGEPSDGRSPDTPPDAALERPHPHQSEMGPPQRRRRRSGIAMALVAVALAIGAIAWARHGAVAQSQRENTTVLAVSPPDRFNRVTITVISAESSPTSFTVRAAQDGVLVSPVRTVTLASGDVWTEQVVVHPHPPGQLVVDLNRGSAAGQPYRSVNRAIGT